MTALIIICIVLGWMLANLWVSLGLVVLMDEAVYERNDLVWLLLGSIVSPLGVVIGGWVIDKIKDSWKRGGWNG